MAKDRSSVATGLNPAAAPSFARVNDALLGGKDNYEADREFVRALLELAPSAQLLARENRSFVRRAVCELASGAGIEQFIELGVGLPTADPTHVVALRVNPAARVVYVDRDPLVVVHGRALLADGEGRTVVQADGWNPAAVVGHPEVGRFIDFSRPVAVVMASMLGWLSGPQAGQVTGCWWQAMAAGSYLVISHAEDRTALRAAAQLLRQRMGVGHLRTRALIAELFGGFELIAPGLVPLPLWRPTTTLLQSAEQVPILAGVGRRLPERGRSR